MIAATRADVHAVIYVPWGGTLTSVVRMTPHTEGEVGNLLTNVLGEQWPNCKLAIAVDDDIDATSPEDIIWSISTRVDAAARALIIPNAKGPPIEPTTRCTGKSPRDVLFSKWGIDATKPAVQHPESRTRFERTLPPHNGAVDLQEFLG